MTLVELQEHEERLKVAVAEAEQQLEAAKSRLDIVKGALMQTSHYAYLERQRIEMELKAEAEREELERKQARRRKHDTN